MHNKNVFLLSLNQALMISGNTLLVATAGLVGLALAGDKSLATLPLALQFLATMFTTIPASLLMQHYGRRAGFLLGACFGITGAITAAWAINMGSFPLFVLGTILVGIFNGFGFYYRFAAVDVSVEGYKTRAISMVMAGGVLAAVLGPNLANWSQNILQPQFVGSYLALMTLYILSFISLTFLKVPAFEQFNSNDNGRSIWQIAKQPLYLGAMLSAALGYGIMVLVMTATPLHMHQHHMHYSDIAFVVEWHVLGMFAPSFITPWIIRRIGIINLLLLGVVINAAAVWFNLAGSSLLHYWSAMVLLGIGWNFLFIGGTTLLTKTYTEVEKGRAQAMNDFVIFTTVTLSSLSAGWLLHHVGWRAVNYGVIPLLIIISIVIITLYVQRRQKSA